MAFNVFDNPDQRAAFLIAVITSPLCILFIVLRFALAKGHGRKIGLEDWFALLSLIFYLVWVVFGLYSVILENGKDVLKPGALSKEQTTTILKFGFAVNPQYCAQQLFAKLSLLALYYRLFSVDKAFVRITYAVGVVQIIWFVAEYFDRWFTCTPVRKVWEPEIEGYCINQSASLAVSETFNSGIDFIMIGMAVYMVKKLNVAFSAKLKLSILFALGGLSGIIGIIRIAEVYGTVGKSGDELPWLLSQMATSVICCCVPLHRSIIPNTGLFEALRSTFFSSSWSGSRGKQSKDNLPSSSFKTIGQKSSNRKMRGTDDWLPLDESRATSSTRELNTRIWAEDEEMGRGAKSETPTYPAQTAQTQYNTDKVI
ncbi:hypothetical protein F4859DRAFT_488485 [Xylaria cf. heliscus]|nr:hypothetical protein F4859DRAFT_488485 [Xylaria cf. heliscus]